MEAVAALLGADVMLEVVGSTDCDDLVEFACPLELELPPQTLGIRRVLGRRPLRPDDRITVPDSQEAWKLVALVVTLESEQLIELALSLLVGHVHDRV